MTECCIRYDSIRAKISVRASFTTAVGRNSPKRGVSEHTDFRMSNGQMKAPYLFEVRRFDYTCETSELIIRPRRKLWYNFRVYVYTMDKNPSKDMYSLQG